MRIIAFSEQDKFVLLLSRLSKELNRKPVARVGSKRHLPSHEIHYIKRLLLCHKICI